MPNILNINTLSTGNVLKYNPVTFTDSVPPSGAGNIVLLNSQSASSSPSIDITSVLTTKYNAYQLLIDGLIAATDATQLLIQFSTDNGATWDTTSNNYAYSTNLWSMETTPVTTGSIGSNAAGTSWVLTNTNDNATPVCLDIRIMVTTSNTLSCTALGTFYNAKYWYVLSGCSYTSSGATPNAIRIVMSSGNITSGTFKLHGIGALA